MTRILSQSGNVIAADFGKRTIEISITCTTIYSDEHILITRATCSMNGAPIGKPVHYMAELATGQIRHI